MMAHGFVYILTNPSMPGLVKIGKTTRDPERRAAELDQTGVPTPFQVEDSVFAPDCGELERHMHKVFDDCRVSAGREFFRIDADIASMQLDALHRRMVNEWVAEFCGDYVVAQPDMIVDEASIDMLATELNAHPFEIVSALSEITVEEAAPILAKWRKKVEARSEERRANLRLVERQA